MTSKLIAIVAGVGPGTGAAVARKFAATYPVVLLARKPENFEGLASEINQSGGKAVGISTDVSDSKSVKSAVEKIKAEFGEGVGAAVSVLHDFFCYWFNGRMKGILGWKRYIFGDDHVGAEDVERCLKTGCFAPHEDKPKRLPHPSKNPN